MIELNTWRQTEQQNKIDRKLVSAFRADLRASLPDRREYDCELLLDHADNPAALKFLRYLVAGRQLPDSPPGPLTVIAASGGNLMSALQPAAEVRQSDETDLATVKAAELAGLYWLRVRLGPLSASDVHSMIPTGPDFADIDDEWPARVVLANTGGHPGAVRRFVDALLRHPGPVLRRGRAIGHQGEQAPHAGRVDPAHGHLPDRPRQPAHRRVPRNVHHARAARHADEADRIVAGDKLTAAKTHDIEVLQAETLWPRPRPRPDAPGRLLPVARFLLLRILGRRPAEDDDSWVNLFAWLSEHTPADDPAGWLHHRFAMGDVVSADLGAQLDECTASEWLDRLSACVKTWIPRAGRSDWRARPGSSRRSRHSPGQPGQPTCGAVVPDVPAEPGFRVRGGQRDYSTLVGQQLPPRPPRRRLERARLSVSPGSHGPTRAGMPTTATSPTSEPGALSEFHPSTRCRRHRPRCHAYNPVRYNCVVPRVSLSPSQGRGRCRWDVEPRTARRRIVSPVKQGSGPVGAVPDAAGVVELDLLLADLAADDLLLCDRLGA
jgi:hypothetical protein